MLDFTKEIELGPTVYWWRDRKSRMLALCVPHEPLIQEHGKTGWERERLTDLDCHACTLGKYSVARFLEE